MPSPSLERVPPLEPPEVESLTRRWARAGVVILTGERGAGEDELARALIEQRSEGVAVLDAEVPHRGRAPSGWLVEELGLSDADSATERTTASLARDIAGALTAATIVVRGAGQADARSLRILNALAGRERGIRLILIEADAAIADAVLAEFRGAVRVALPRMSGAMLRAQVERLIGAAPVEEDVLALEDASGGSFRALCWLLDLAAANDGLVIDRGAVRLRFDNPAAGVLPPWSIERLSGDPAAEALAVTGSLPLLAVERLGLLSETAALETAGLAVTVDGWVRLTSPALRWDVAGRLGASSRRLLVARIVEALGEGSVLESMPGSDAAELMMWAWSVQLPLPVHLEEKVIGFLIRSGRHRRAVNLAGRTEHPLHPSVHADLAYAHAVLDEDDAAAAIAHDVLGGYPAAATVETVGLALVLGLFRDSSSDVYDDALAAVIAWAAEHAPDSARMLRGCLALVRPSADAPWAELVTMVDAPGGAALTRARAARVLAMRAWKDGRPISATALVEQAAQLHEGCAIDAAMALFLRAAGGILTPDFAAAGRALAASAVLGSPSRLGGLLWAAQAVYRGDVAAARLIAEPLLDEHGEIDDPVLAPMAASIVSIASSMLGDRERAREMLEAAYDLESSSEIISAANAHLRGIAATQLRPEPLHDEGIAGYSAAREGGRTLDFRLLELLGTYRLADEINASPQSELWVWIADQLAGPDPLEGVPELFAALARAVAARDVGALLALVRRMFQEELLQDAKVLAIRLAGHAAADIPAAARRGILRLAKHRFDRERRDAASDSILTPREREVAAQIVAGLSDREIAERLGRSRRTVTTHVGRILRKLGLVSRRELTAELAEQHGVETAGP
ncbi:helix-turn-helix transcriptional regulator [Microbacterium bovistercoris]|uniref:helix-turn-helix transcriptional regulator n=1 Tax=Microbacterium bovistercoris TaxID=2293570 RepID=UPI001C6E8F54|nr:LuxR family transcriptional regulator [Microbacterium bovistercoris]